ncbi:MAG: hypothetical protein KU29_04540 [Sulfurovum sp. FS06-10]|nr:MAG: hypothetical protein KU29_04540 [Sulfurovum sp. FS06-10]
MFEVLEWIVKIYVVVAILLSASMVIFNQNSLKKLTSWKMLLLFALSPLVALRVLKKPYKKRGK